MSEVAAERRVIKTLIYGLERGIPTFPSFESSREKEKEEEEEAFLEEVLRPFDYYCATASNNDTNCEFLSQKRTAGRTKIRVDLRSLDSLQRHSSSAFLVHRRADTDLH